MDIEFDPANDTVNIAKHGVSLSRTVDLNILVFPKMSATAMARRLAFTSRDGIIRAISLRLAHKKEMDGYALQEL